MIFKGQPFKAINRDGYRLGSDENGVLEVDDSLVTPEFTQILNAYGFEGENPKKKETK